MYTDTVVIASLLVILGAIGDGVGFFVYIWLDNSGQPGDGEPETVFFRHDTPPMTHFRHRAATVVPRPRFARGA